MSEKPTNPKDFVGSGKSPLSIVPSTMTAYASMAFLEGALKYGANNWRANGVKSSIYIDALYRHIGKYWNGEWADEETGVPHLSSALACIGIIIDAHECGMLNDDRPPSIDLTGLLKDQEKIVSNLKKAFEDKKPKHYTIKDQNGE